MFQQQPSAPQFQDPQVREGFPSQSQAPAQSPQESHPSSPNQQRDNFALKFQQLSAREKQLRELESQLKSRADKVSSLESAFQRANDDPFALLQELNLDVERLYEVKKGGGKFAPGEMQVRQLKSELDKLREQVAAKERAEQEAQQRKAQEEALANFRQNVSKSLQESDKYELAKARGGVDDVLDLIANHFSQTSEMMDLDQALAQVEQRYEEEVQKLLQTNKARKWFDEYQSKSRQNNPTPESQWGSSTSKTLTNSLTTQTAPRPSFAETEEDAFRRAVEILRGGRG